MKDQTLTVVGISGNDISESIREHLRTCTAVVATKSTLEKIKCEVPDLTHIEQWIPIAPVEACLRIVEKNINHHSIVIFTSGDPLFYGLGKLLVERFPKTRINFQPALSSMQLCFARFGISWEDALFVSLHGRPLSQLARVLYRHKLFILTDKENNPASIAHYLTKLIEPDECNHYTMYIGENLGCSNEKLSTLSIDETLSKKFSQPNSIILVKNTGRATIQDVRFGLTEKEIRHSRGLITKNEVRAAVLHALRIPSTGVFWDIGAGSGSISIEAARLNPGLDVYAIDFKPDAIRNIHFNRNKYKCWNISIHQGRAPEILTGMPDPDCVFIGGSGGMMKEILEYVTQNSSRACTLVLTGVLEKTCTTAPELLHNLGYAVDISVLSTRRFRYPASEQIEFNPIHIIRGTRTDA